VGCCASGQRCQQLIQHLRRRLQQAARQVLVHDSVQQAVVTTLQLSLFASIFQRGRYLLSLLLLLLLLLLRC
jgi:hypothetical protein